jgi:hypothetical protein
MKREDDEKLWELLGQVPKVEFSPFFARNVLRRIRERSNWSVHARFWLSWRRLVPISGLAAAVIGTFLFLHTPASRQDLDTEPDPVAKIDVQDYDVVADLDDLLASDESNLWDDNSSDNSSL